MGNSTPRSTTQTNITQYPPWLSNAMQANIGIANSLADQMGEQGFQSYDPAQRIAGLNDLQLGAINQAQQFQGAWQPLTQRAADFNAAGGELALNAANPIGTWQANAATAGPSALAQAAQIGPVERVGRTQDSTYNAATLSGFPNVGADMIRRSDIRDVKPGSFLQGDLPGYMNPFTDLVTNNALQQLEQSRQMQNLNNADAATKARAFGGSRHGVVEGLTNQAFAKQAGDLALNAAQANFGQAQNAMQSDLARTLQAQLANQGQDFGVASQNAQLGTQGNFLGGQLGAQIAMQNMAAMNDASRFNATQGRDFNLANMQAANAAAAQDAQLRQQAGLTNAAAWNQQNQYNAGLGQQANLLNAQLGLQGDTASRDYALRAAAALQSGAGLDAGMAQQLQSMGYTDINNLLNAGNIAQDQQQLMNDFAYQQWLQQQNFPIDLLNLRMGAVSNTPYQPGSSTTSPIYRNRTAGFLGGAATGAASGYQMSGNPWGAVIGGLLGGAYGAYG